MRTGEPMAPLLGEFEKLRPLQPELETDGETVAHIIQLLDEKDWCVWVCVLVCA